MRPWPSTPVSADGKSYCQHQLDAELIICAGCQKPYYMTQVHGRRVKCLACEPWDYQKPSEHCLQISDVSGIPMFDP